MVAIVVQLYNQENLVKMPMRIFFKGKRKENVGVSRKITASDKKNERVKR